MSRARNPARTHHGHKYRPYWSRERILRIVIAEAQLLGHAPSATELGLARKAGRELPCPRTVYEYFPSMMALHRAAGLEPANGRKGCRRRRMCAAGVHVMSLDNTIVWTCKNGWEHRRCRQCKYAAARRYRRHAAWLRAQRSAAAKVTAVARLMDPAHLTARNAELARYWKVSA